MYIMVVALEDIKKTKKLGLLINSGSQIFSNGIIQNAYFIYQLFMKMGIQCNFLCHEENPKALEYKNIPLYQISTNELIFDPNEYFMIMTVTRSIGQQMYDILKKHKIAVIAFICGNNLMMDLEDFVRGSRNNQTSFVGRGQLTDELWVIPSFSHSLDYLEICRGKPAYTIPHLWSPDILRDNFLLFYKRDNDSLLHYNLENHAGKKIAIVVLEPNMALLKSCWIPYVAAEKIELTQPDILAQVWLFNFPEVTRAWNMVDNMTVRKKARIFKRLTIPEILVYFNTQTDIMPIFVSHQVLTELNYLYYELLYYGYPLVHNSTMLEGCGYYYPQHDIIKCSQAILHAHKHHNKNLATYKDNADAFINKIHPLNDEMAKVWTQMMNESVLRAQSAT